MEDRMNTEGEKTPEEIEREMAATRESLTEKVAALESQVVGTVQEAANTLTGAVGAVQTLVTDAPEAVSDTVKLAAAAATETVKDAFDIAGRVRRNPWLALGTSFALGYIVGRMTRPSSHPTIGGASEGAPGAVPTPPTARAAYAVPSREAPSKQEAASTGPGLFDPVMELVGEKIQELAKTGLETVSTALRQNIQEGIPILLNEAASRFMTPGPQPEPEPEPEPEPRQAYPSVAGSRFESPRYPPY